MDSIAAAQRDMRDGYYWGAPGVAVSGLVWLISGVVTLTFTPFNGIVTLLLGGMAIHPLSVLLCKLLGHTGTHQKQNPLGPLTMQGTVWMVWSMVIAVIVAVLDANYFYPAMLLIIGGRYLTFTTLYCLKVYYALGALLAAVAIAAASMQLPIYAVALAGGAVELVFAGIILSQSKKALATANG